MKSKVLLMFCFIMLSNALIGQIKDSQSKRIGNQFEYEDCSCSVKIDLTIHNGLYGVYGGQAIGESEETSKGAVTAANLNDTDGDMVIDNLDDSVVSSSSGRDEVDLMKLEIASKGTFVTSCPNLELVLQGSIKLWKNKTKGSLQSNVIPISSLPLTIWVEASQVSLSVRDIVIQAVVDNDVKDEIKATAIWIDKKMVHTYNGVRTSSPQPSTIGIDNQDFLNFINTYATASDGSLYGFGTYRPIPGTNPSTDGFFGGRILFEFELKPTGIEAELSSLGIKYDISRRIERNNEYLTDTSIIPKTEVSSFPQQIEEGNDDSECFCPTGPSDMLDEDAIPVANRIFSYDAPSEITLGSARAFSVRRLNFEEFARVSFGIDVVGNIQEGSQCSEDYNWNLDYIITSNSSIHPTDPYNPDYQLMTQSSGGVTLSSNPRRIVGTGNGQILLSGISSSSVFTYLLEFSASGNKWTLYEKTSSGSNPVANSNVSTTGPWNINYSTVNISITNGAMPFSTGSVFAFNIWDVPTTTNSMTAN